VGALARLAVEAVGCTGDVPDGAGARRHRRTHVLQPVGNSNNMAAQTPIPQNWPDVRVGLDRNGAATVLGFVANADEASRLQAWLRQTENLRNAAVNVRVGDDLVRRVTGLLPDKSLQARYAGTGVVRVTGTSTSKALREEIRRLNDDLSEVVRIDDAITYNLPPDPPMLRPLPFRISSVSPGPTGSFGTDTGVRYFAGSVLSDGAEVVAIRADEIEFKLGETRIVYPLK
jgi:hypothetical protein